MLVKVSERNHSKFSKTVGKLQKGSFQYKTVWRFYKILKDLKLNLIFILKLKYDLISFTPKYLLPKIKKNTNLKKNVCTPAYVTAICSIKVKIQKYNRRVNK